MVPFRAVRDFVLAFLILAFSTTGVFAQRVLLTADIAPSSPPARSGAPITVNWVLTPQGSALLEGRFLLIVHEGREVLGRFQTEEIALGGSQQMFRTVIPPLDMSHLSSQVEIELVFLGKRERVSLGQHLLRVAPAQRSFVIGVCDPWQSSVSGERQQFINRFKFEQFNPSEIVGRTISTVAAPLRPDDLPTDSLGYCGFDLVVLVDEGFSELREKQLGVLLDWVAAGGSLCVAPSGVLAPHHASFLNKLCGANAAESSPFLLDGQGRLMPALDADSTADLLRRHGLGRVAIVRDWQLYVKSVALRAREWREAVAFLWKLRQDQMPAVIASGKWDAELVQKHHASFNDDNNYRALSAVPIQTGDQLLSRLMPERVQVVPFALIGLILFFYVALIGPGDWFLLGFLKQRKLTWVLFPAVTVTTALFTVWLSHWYMGTADSRRGVIFLDVGDEGKIVRRSRFELLFTGAFRQVHTDVKRAIFSPLSQTTFNTSSYVRYQQQYGNRAESELVAPATFEGRVPFQYRVMQEIPQWTPQVNRLFSIAAEEQPPAFDWDAFGRRFLGDAAIFSDAAFKQELTQKVMNAFGHGAAVQIFHAGKQHPIAGRTELALAESDDPLHAYQPARRIYVGPTGEALQVRRTFLEDASVCPPLGLFSLVSQIAPNGGHDFEDLTLLDPSDPNQWLLVIVVPRGNDLLVYRKLYVRKE